MPILHQEKDTIKTVTRRCDVVSTTKSTFFTNTVIGAKRPVEHRKKPFPLTKTGRANAATTREYPGIESKFFKDGTYCNGVYYPPNYEKWTYTIEYVTSAPSDWVNKCSFDQGKWNFLCREKIRNLSTDLSGTIAEIEELEGILTNMLRVIHILRRCINNPVLCIQDITKRRIPFDSLWDIPCAWLYNSFAIQPAVGAVKTIADDFLNPNANWKRRAFTFTQTERYGNVILYNNDFLVEVIETLSSRTRFDVVLKVPQGYDQWNLGNPEEWAWERIPFSFVIDWMIPVSTYIANKAALINVESGSGCITHRRVRSMRQLAAGRVNSRKLVRPFRRFYKSHERSLAGLPGIEQHFPRGPSSSLASLYNAIALLTQQRMKP